MQCDASIESHTNRNIDFKLIQSVCNLVAIIVMMQYVGDPETHTNGIINFEHMQTG